MNKELKISEIILILGNSNDADLQIDAAQELSNVLGNATSTLQQSMSVETIINHVFYAYRNNNMNLVKFLVGFVTYTIRENNIRISLTHSNIGGYEHGMIDGIIDDDMINEFILTIYHYGFIPSTDFRKRCLNPDIAAFMEL